MADTNLTMTATVVDAFSRPLAKLRQDLEATSKTRALPDMQKGWQSLRGEVGAFSREIQSQALPSMAAMSLRGAAIGTALVTAGVALRTFSSDVKGVTVLSKEMGFQSADSLLKLQSLGKRAGMEFQETQQSLLTFSRSMDQIKRRWGDVYNGLRQTPIGAEIAEQLNKATNFEEAVEIAIREIRKIQNPVKQREIAQAIFGTEMWARVANEATPKVMAEINRLSAHIDQKTQEAASKFESNMSRMSEAAQKLKIEAMGPLLELSVKLWDQLEKPVGDAFAAFSKDMIAALPKINEGFGQLKTIWEGLASVDFSKNIEAVKQFEKLTEIPGIGKMVQGFREGGSTETGLGSVANKALEATKEFLGVKPAEGAGVKTPDGRPFIAPGLGTGGRANDLIRAQDKNTTALENLTQKWNEGVGAAYGSLASGGGMAPGQSAASSVWGAVKSYFGGGGGGAGGVGGAAAPGGAAGGSAPGGGTPGTPSAVPSSGPVRGAGAFDNSIAGQAGLPAGMRNNNPGNLIYSGNSSKLYPGVIGPSTNTDNAGRDHQIKFDTPQSGMEAAYILARRIYGRGNNTVRSIMRTWTPSNPQAGANIARSMGISPDAPININDPVVAQKFMRGLLSQEHGEKSALYSDALIKSAISSVQAGGGAGGKVGAAGSPHAATSPVSQEEIQRNLPGLHAATRLTREAGLEVTSDLRHGGGTSLHNRARAFDVRARTREAADAAMAKMRETYAKAGLKEGDDYNFLDETRHPSPGATGPHVHVSLTEAGVAKLNPANAEKPKPGAALKESTNYQAKENAKANKAEVPTGKLTAEGTVQVVLSDSLAEKNASVKTSGMFKEANIKRERPRVA